MATFKREYNLDEEIAKDYERLTELPGIGEELVYLSSNFRGRVGTFLVVTKTENDGFVWGKEGNQMAIKYYLLGRKREFTPNLVWE